MNEQEIGTCLRREIKAINQTLAAHQVAAGARLQEALVGGRSLILYRLRLAPGERIAKRGTRAARGERGTGRAPPPPHSRQAPSAAPRPRSAAFGPGADPLAAPTPDRNAGQPGIGRPGLRLRRRPAFVLGFRPGPAHPDRRHDGEREKQPAQRDAGLDGMGHPAGPAPHDHNRPEKHRSALGCPAAPQSGLGWRS